MGEKNQLIQINTQALNRIYKQSRRNHQGVSTDIANKYI